jgi:hypothetical protein
VGASGDRDENGTETDGTKWCHICFYIFCGSRNKYRNTGNKYENGYFQKQKWSEYSTNMDEKRMIIGTKRQPESCSKTQAS